MKTHAANARPFISHARLAPRDGFSLVELLVSMAVAAILITALMQSLLSASDSWSSQSKHVTAQREARTALRLLADDISSAVALPTGGPMQEEAPGQITTPLRFWLTNTGDRSSSSRMAFLRMARKVPMGRETGHGDLRLVLYDVILSDDGGASGLEPEARSQKLVRCEFSAGETFRRIRDHFSHSSALFHDTDWQRMRDPGSASSEVASITVLAHDVIRFELKALEKLVNGERPQAVWPELQLPNWVDMTLRVTNRQTARWLRTEADWRGQGERAEQIHNNTQDIYPDDPEVRTFSMRLRLPSQVW